MQNSLVVAVTTKLYHHLLRVDAYNIGGDGAHDLDPLERVRKTPVG